MVKAFGVCTCVRVRVCDKQCGLFQAYFSVEAMACKESKPQKNKCLCN